LKRILVIADDLTGAAEIGGIAVSHGLSAEIQTGDFRGPEADVLIIDTNSRPLPPTAAARRVKECLQAIDPGQFDLIYKKTDSMLRGPMAAELTAILESCRIERAIFVPQNPSRGRSIRQGNYHIEGVPLDLSPVGVDVEHPATTANVYDLLDPDRTFDVYCASPDEGVPDHRIVLGEAASSSDVRHWTKQLNPSTLPAGGADFFAAVLQSCGVSQAPTKPFAASGNTMTIFGSASIISRTYVSKLIAAGATICDMPAILFDASTHTHDALPAWQNTILSQLNSCEYAFVAVRHPVDPTRAQRVRQTIAELLAHTLSSTAIGVLFIEGGATAAAFTQRMGWTRLLVECQIAIGIVALRPVAPSAPVIVLKPGTYPWPVGLLPGGAAQ
jgi:uncharacterized protein YgbK (DUF1537 family)